MLEVLAEQWAILAFVLLCLVSIAYGGPWRLLVRLFALAAAVCMALSTFCGNMHTVSVTVLHMVAEALRALGRESVANGRAALREQGERA